MNNAMQIAARACRYENERFGPCEPVRLDPTALVSEPPSSVLGLLALVALLALRCKPLRGPSAFSAKAKP